MLGDVHLFLFQLPPAKNFSKVTVLRVSQTVLRPQLDYGQEGTGGLENLMEHGARQAAGLGVLLAGVIGSEQGEAI